MGEFYLPVESCRLDIDGKVPRAESASIQNVKNLYRTNVSQEIRQAVSRIIRGVYVGYPARVTDRCDGVKAIFEVKGIKEHLRVKGLSWESKYLKEFFSLLQPNDVFWDVGAYVGVWSLLAAKKNPAVEVYSFEPEPECFQALKHNSDSFRPASLACSGREVNALHSKPLTVICIISQSILIQLITSLGLIGRQNQRL